MAARFGVYVTYMKLCRPKNERTATARSEQQLRVNLSLLLRVAARFSVQTVCALHKTYGKVSILNICARNVTCMILCRQKTSEQQLRVNSSLLLRMAARFTERERERETERGERERETEREREREARENSNCV